MTTKEAIYTEPLRCYPVYKGSKVTSVGPYLLKVSVITYPTGMVTLQPVSAFNLATVRGKRTITQAEYDARPRDPNDPKVEAVWALKQCLWEA